MTPTDLIHKLNLNDVPDAVKEQAKLSILDLIGIGAGGAGTGAPDYFSGGDTPIADMGGYGAGWPTYTVG